jgi:threonine aldolase
VTPVELRSDTFTLPTPEMLQAMVSAELGDDVYGEDPTVARLEALAAGLLGKEAACFMPSGTMCNLTALLTHCPRGTAVIVGAETDIYIYEAGGAAVCGGVTYVPVPNLRDGTIDLDALDDVMPPDPTDPQFARPALLCLENPQNRCGGRVLPLAYLAEAAAWAATRGLRLHLDGARLFNAALSAGVPAAEIARHADSVQFCLSKGLGAPVGSMLVGSQAFVDQARRTRKMLGGGMRQAGVLAAAGIVALERRARLAEDHATARRLAAGLAAIPGVELDPGEVETNMVFFRVAGAEARNPELIAAAEARGVGLAELGHGRIRCVTHQGIGPDDIDHAVDVVASIVTAGPARDTTPARRNHADHDHAADAAVVAR